jgi:6-phosphogluconolactonase/glucosamine-6-phosphate isomerase/deaminase
MPVLLDASAVHFLISGKDKAAPLKKALAPDTPDTEIPTGRVFRSARKVVCWADEAVAAG